MLQMEEKYTGRSRPCSKKIFQTLVAVTKINRSIKMKIILQEGIVLRKIIIQCCMLPSVFISFTYSCIQQLIGLRKYLDAQSTIVWSSYHFNTNPIITRPILAPEFHNKAYLQSPITCALYYLSVHICSFNGLANVGLPELNWYKNMFSSEFGCNIFF